MPVAGSVMSLVRAVVPFSALNHCVQLYCVSLVLIIPCSKGAEAAKNVKATFQLAGRVRPRTLQV